MASPASHTFPAAGRELEQHWVQFYATDGFLAEQVARFVASGLVAGAPAVIIATTAHRESFAEHLRGRDLDVDRLVETKQLVMLDAEETLARFMVGGTPDWPRFDQVVGGLLAQLAAASPGKSIYAYGEMVDVLWRRGEQDAAIRLEEMWNDLRAHHEFQLLCAYVIDSFYKEAGIPRICATHSHVLPPEQVLDQSGVADTVRSLVGEIARRNDVEAALRESLRRARAAEEAASAAKADLEDFLENAVVAIHRVDKDGIIRWANPAELALVGYEPHEYIGHHIAQFHADQRSIDDMLTRLRCGETLHDYEAKIRRKNGEIRIVHVSSNFQSRDGGTTRCFSRDVTDAKRAERRAAVLLDLTTALSRALDAEGAARVLIHETRKLVGAPAGGVLLLDQTGTKSERMIIDGDHYRDAAAALDSVPLSAAMPICDAARSGKPVWVVGKHEIERRYPHLAALRENVSAHTWGAVPIVFERRVLGAIGFKCTDERHLDEHEESLLMAVATHCGQAIERARLHEATQAARAEAEQASRAKDEFLAILGHELRNPLAPVLTAVQLMRLRGETASTREQNIIERQVNHLIHIVDDLLDVSRVARGKIELAMRPLKLRALVAKAVEITSPLFEERRHRVTIDQPDEDIWLEADETRLCQVLTNLLSNAAKYTPPQGQIEVRVTRGNGRVTIRVRDSGNGIAPELLPRIFELFVQGQRTHESHRGGLGIGLALVRSLVQLHHGSVSAHSDGPGRGSEFFVDLPLIDLRTVQKPSELEWDLRQRVAVTPRRILVVDDNEDAGELLAEMLRSVGHEVVCAIDGPRALDIVKSFAPEVAILDIGLPVMDGYELAAALRARLAGSVRFLAVTGYGQERDRQRAAQAGFEGHLVKPVSLQKVLAAIEVSPTP